MRSLHNKLLNMVSTEHLIYAREYQLHDIHKNFLNKILLRGEEVYDIKNEKLYRVNMIEYEDSIYLAPASYSSFNLFFPFKK